MEMRLPEMVITSNTLPEPEKLSTAPAQTANEVTDEQQWPGIDSRYRLIVVAALRSKQLLHGARPRIEADTSKRRNTSIALEEVKRGLVPFTTGDKDRKHDGDNL
jgi:DNA-directed RNA polymerase omega subunit